MKEKGIKEEFEAVNPTIVYANCSMHLFFFTFFTFLLMMHKRYIKKRKES